MLAEQVQTRKGSSKGKKVADVPVSPVIKLPSDWLESKEFEFNVGGEPIKVKFVGLWSHSGSFHHFEFFGKTISQTGYRSEFVHLEQAINWETPLDYAKEKVTELYATLLKEQKRQQRRSKKIKNSE